MGEFTPKMRPPSLPPPPITSKKKKIGGWGLGGGGDVGKGGEGVDLEFSGMGGDSPQNWTPPPPTPIPLSPSPQTMWKPLKMEPRWESDPKNGEGASEIWDPPP